MAQDLAKCFDQLYPGGWFLRQKRKKSHAAVDSFLYRIATLAVRNWGCISRRNVPVSVLSHRIFSSLPFTLKVGFVFWKLWLQTSLSCRHQIRDGLWISHCKAGFKIFQLLGASFPLNFLIFFFQFLIWVLQNRLQHSLSPCHVKQMGHFIST